MAAPKNNQNAHKWTEARVQAHLEEIHRMALEPEGMFLGRILASLGLHKNVWCYWRRKFAGNEDILYQMDLIKECCEANLFTAALQNKVTSAFAIMCLKANYGWREYPVEDKMQPAVEIDAGYQDRAAVQEYSRAA